MRAEKRGPAAIPSQRRDGGNHVAVAHEAAKHGYQGVVCGHIHRAEIREVNGVLYCNDGDWVESRSALVEHFDGRLELSYWKPEAPGVQKPVLVKAA